MIVDLADTLHYTKNLVWDLFPVEVFPKFSNEQILWTSLAVSFANTRQSGYGQYSEY